MSRIWSGPYEILEIKNNGKICIFNEIKSLWCNVRNIRPILFGGGRMSCLFDNINSNHDNYNLSNQNINNFIKIPSCHTIRNQGDQTVDTEKVMNSTTPAEGDTSGGRAQKL
ncbi:hypothetical protein DMUE_2913, partial [Dictyocoela muelleri]